MLERIFFVSIIICLGCNPKNIAPERNFYFTIETGTPRDSGLFCRDYLESQIPLQKYIITNGSGQVWPYYKAYNLNEPVSKDSIMPPHWFVHKMIPYETDNKIGEDEYLVKIELFKVQDTIPNYRVIIYKMVKGELNHTASTITYFIQSSEYSTQEELCDLLLKNTLRYSFK